MATNLTGIRAAKVAPAFLHSNSTSHTWPFSAIAELIDNAYDPDVSASELWINKQTINKYECLTFVDSGNGMTPEKLFKMLSFGYCDKVPVGNVKPIGYYGNGFKSGSMRLGKDALVFTRSASSSSVGFLSQSYLNAIVAEAVLVPIVTWEHNGAVLQTDDFMANLNAILQYSIFQNEEELLTELKALEKMRTGTKIILYNLKTDSSGNFELDFTSNIHDIRNPETPVIDLTSIIRPVFTASPEYRRSLREYCSILYLKPRMKIFLRGVKVKTKLISKSLSCTETDVYKPTWLQRPVKLVFGFTNDTEPEAYGLMMYHKNRLIRAYEKVGCQKNANDHGVGVVGIVEANFLEPIHNKQDFNRTERYIAFMQNTSTKLNDYYYEKTQSENPAAATVPQSQLPDWTWVQCDQCLKWRRLPTGYTDKLPEKWFCYLNPDAHFNRCDIPEEPEDDDEALQPTYRKTYKKAQEEKRRLAKLKEEEKLKEKEDLLKKKEHLLQCKMKEITQQKEELSEVSSSEDRVDRKPTVADLMLAKKTLKIQQERLANQEMTIKQLEIQKKQNEEKCQAMLRIADSLHLSNVQSNTLEERVLHLTGTGNSTVTSSSSLRPPHKRKSNFMEGNGEKVTKFETEDGVGIIFAVAQSNENGKLIDLTLDDDDQENMDIDSPDTHIANLFNNVNDSVTGASKDNRCCTEETEKMSKSKTDIWDNCDKIVKAAVNKKSNGDNLNKSVTSIEEEYTEMKIDDDIKPDKDKLDKQIADIEETLKACDKEKSKEMESEHEEKKVFVQKGTQTVPIIIKLQKGTQTVPTVTKFASAEEVNQLKLNPLEQKQMLLQKARELEDTQKSLSSLQENIWQLLKIIVPNFDYGEPENIENLILDFIRVNSEQVEPSESGVQT